MKKRKVGRPAYTPTPEQRARVEALAAQDMEFTDIMVFVGLRSINSFKKHYAQEIKMGLRRARAAIENKLYSKALSGDNACMFRWLEVHGGEKWRPQTSVKHDHSGKISQRVEIDVSKLTTEQLVALEPVFAMMASEEQPSGKPN